MNTTEARNNFIVNKYSELNRMSIHCARKVQKTFSSVPFCDLQAFAFEGIVVALNKADLESDTVFAYVYRYAINFTLNGALQMLGIRRKRDNDSPINDQNTFIITCNPKELCDYIEAKQRNRISDCSCAEMNALNYSLEVQQILKTIEGSFEYFILLDILNDRKLSEIAKKYNTTIRQIRRHIEKLKIITKNMEEEIPIDKYLSPVPKGSQHSSHFIIKSKGYDFLKDIKTRKPQFTRKSLNRHSLNNQLEPINIIPLLQHNTECKEISSINAIPAVSYSPDTITTSSEDETHLQLVTAQPGETRIS